MRKATVLTISLVLIFTALAGVAVIFNKMHVPTPLDRGQKLVRELVQELNDDQSIIMASGAYMHGRGVVLYSQSEFNFETALRSWATLQLIRLNEKFERAPKGESLIWVIDYGPNLDNQEIIFTPLSQLSNTNIHRYQSGLSALTQGDMVRTPVRAPKGVMSEPSTRSVKSAASVHLPNISSDRNLQSKSPLLPSPVPIQRSLDLLQGLREDRTFVEAGWFPISGQWRFKGGALTQLEPDLYDRIISYQERFSKFSLRVKLHHTQGYGGGILFNMPKQNLRNGSHMVRFSEDASTLFWGYFDQNGEFRGESYTLFSKVGQESQELKVMANGEAYTISLNGEVLAKDVPLWSKEGHVGLTSSKAIVTFDLVEVETWRTENVKIR